MPIPFFLAPPVRSGNNKLSLFSGEFSEYWNPGILEAPWIPQKRWPQLQEPQKAPKLWPWGVLLLTAKAAATPPVYPPPPFLADDAPPRLSAVCLPLFLYFGN